MPIVVVDDNRTNLQLLEQILGTAGYRNVRGLTDPHEVETELRASPPDLMLLDLHMPSRDGFDVLGSLQSSLGPPDHLPVCVITADTSLEVRRRALQMGARDFLVKPVDPVEVMMRVRNLLESRYLTRVLPRELELTRLESLRRLVRFSGRRDDPELVLGTGALAARLARAMDLPEALTAQIATAAVFHDLGNVGVPETILRKPGPLSPAEVAAARRHTVIGAEILGAGGETIETAALIARYHHERWDGSGYPDGLAGEEIPLPARIVAVAARYQGLVGGRPYRSAATDPEARAALVSRSGSRFDPAVVSAFTRLG